MAEMLLAKDHDVIEAVPPDRSDQPLRESILPGGSIRNRAIAYAHRCEAPNESLAIGAIAITNDMARRCAYRKLKTAVGSVAAELARAWWLEGRYRLEIVLQNVRS
jgi:hypothetical protein